MPLVINIYNNAALKTEYFKNNKCVIEHPIILSKVLPSLTNGLKKPKVLMF